MFLYDLSILYSAIESMSDSLMGTAIFFKSRGMNEKADALIKDYNKIVNDKYSSFLTSPITL
jgi:hypothetical protein